MTTTDRVTNTLSRRQRMMAQSRLDRRRRPLAMVIAGGLLLGILALLGVGFYITFTLPPQRVVANVNEVEFTLGDMATLIKANAAFRAQSGAASGLASFPFQVLDNLVDGEIIKQAAPALGLHITAEEVEARLRENFYPKVPTGQNPPKEQLEREYKENYLSYLAIARYSEEKYRDIIRGDLLRVKAADTFEDRVPAIEEQVYVEWIMINQENNNPLQLIESIKKQMTDKDDFGIFAQKFNDDKRYADFKGLVGWIPRGAFLPLDETLFTIEHNVVSEPVFHSNGYFILMVTDGPQTREISDQMREAIKTSLFEEWIGEKRKTNSVNVEFGSEEYEWLVRKTHEAVPVPTAQPSQQGRIPQ